jgi:dipeptidyl aminopeptidase/acylaminoacyl peptidase
MRPLLRSRLILLLVLALPAALQAQDKRPLTLDDYGAWNRIAQVEISPDGRWLSYALRPNDGDATFIVKELDGNTVHQATNGSRAAFSDDSRWVAFMTTPPEDEADKLREQKKPVPSTLHLLDLQSGDEETFEQVQSFAFAAGSGYLAVLHDRADRQAEQTGADFLLRDLGGGSLLPVGNVAEYAFDEDGAFLAYTVDAANQSGNGLYVMQVSDGRVRPVDTGEQRYEDLTWSEAGPDLAVLRGDTPEGKEHQANTLVVVRGLDGGQPRVTTYDPSTDPSFPEGFVLSELADTRWTEDGRRVVVGIKEQADEAKKPEKGEERANVDVWHWADDRLQSVQMVQADADRRYTYASVYNVESGRFVRLATDDMRRVDVVGKGKWAVGRDDHRYRDDLDVEGGRADYVRLDPATGAAQTLVEGIRRPMGASPEGAYYVYVRDDSVRATDLETLETTNLSASAGIDFMNGDFDLVAERPAWGLAGWTEDGKVLLDTKYDVYAVPLAGGAAVAVSGGRGARDEIQFRVVDLEPDASGSPFRRFGPPTDFVDPDGATLSAYGEWTKKSGYFRARPGQDPQELLFADEMIGDLTKADSTDVVVLTRQTFQEFPDYWVSDTRLQSPRKVTDANPQIEDFLWGRRVLVDYVDQRGNKLQATLTLPAGYEEGQRYPMVVYFYEKMSQRHHQFSMPVYDDRPHMSTYASNGYLVLMPDIVYDDGYPGSSALDDVTAAAKKVVDLGYADPDHIGLQGHSWGGYETSFILTQTDMFACIVTGAPLTDLMSMNNILYKRTGNGNGPILQWSQGRMGDTPWDDLARWRSQSPIQHVPDISTPFLILQGTADGAVDWNQGLELYTSARRLGKKVIFLSYPDEPHHLSKEANQKDFQVRMRQFFDHYLMGKPEPDWMKDGVPFLDKGKKGPDGKTVG